MKKFILLLAVMASTVCTYAGDKDTSNLSAEDQKKLEHLNALFKTLDSAEKSTHYQTGNIALSNGVAHLNVPAGFKFIDAQQSQYILEKLWHNLPDPSVLGMLVKDSFHLNSLQSDWAFMISYDDMGYVKDDDADKIKYDELLTELKKDAETSNLERKKQGLDEMHLLNWAATPYYDKQNKVLHWAKAFSVEGEEDTTLNYDVRILGRKGVLSLNALATMEQLEDVKKNIPAVLKMAQFDKGYKYEDFDSGIDKVAAWTIGGLVAGKVLAKVGFLAVILKFWKLLVLGIAGGFAAIKRFFTGKKKEDELAIDQPAQSDDSTPEA
ncbi:MAG: DUF2167 domain-containing protein [Chitinophagaceae bacterium]